MTIKRTRFAPRPNGKLHLGHAYSAIISEKLAKVVGLQSQIREDNKRKLEFLKKKYGEK